METKNTEEESILQENGIFITSESNVLKRVSDEINQAIDSNERQNQDKEKLELAKRVQQGEITPFQAVENHEKVQKTKGTFNKTTQLLDFEKYLLQQAEFAKQRKNVKKKSRPEKPPAQPPTKKPKEEFPQISKPPASIVKDIPDESSESEYFPSDEAPDTDGEKCMKRSASNKRIKVEKSSTNRTQDDGDEDIYRERIETTNCTKLDKSVHKIDNLFKVPQCIWKRLYKYQKVSVQWLWELHGRDLGGLLADEMGLGKTVQVIAFLAGLDCSNLLSDGGRFRGLGPTLIVCPATLMEQWVKHCHEWWPILRVAVLHQSGTFNGDVEYLIKYSIKNTGGIVITSYSGVLNHKEILTGTEWHYIILDEGHKIRNPQAKVSQAVKEFSTPHRLLLTGSPMQNSLKELWSLFDFILPGKLGTLSAFMEHCVTPIVRGGYSNASSLQEATALQMATMLKDAISPYMLRRTKTDVKHHVTLPTKNEQVLFCSLTLEQRQLYEDYLKSENVCYVLHERKNQHTGRHRARLLIALSALKKICNHPDLFIYGSCSDEDEELNADEAVEKFGHWKRSGKMTVVRSLLKIWKKQEHRVLLFAQGTQTLTILESLLQKLEYRYLRLDGGTPISQRQQTIESFNTNQKYFVFLLTTRVGGLGLNLTGANRVILYDPDWNPATDAQARERAWRIGQNKNVTIYRLITAGTIEEKIYHRQIFKLLLSNRVLEDPRQRRLFKTSDLVELFHLNEMNESDKLFPTSSKLKPNKFSEKKIKEMKNLASALSKEIQGNLETKRDDTIVRRVVDKLLTDVDEIEDNRKKKKKTKVGAIFEGARVACLLGRRFGTEDEQMETNDDDQYVLTKLFAKSGVNSAFQHDSLLTNDEGTTSGTSPMEKLARNTAQESMDHIRQSRKWCWKPSWK